MLMVKEDSSLYMAIKQQCMKRIKQAKFDPEEEKIFGIELTSYSDSDQDQGQTLQETDKYSSGYNKYRHAL